MRLTPHTETLQARDVAAELRGFPHSTDADERGALLARLTDYALRSEAERTRLLSETRRGVDIYPQVKKTKWLVRFKPPVRGIGRLLVGFPDLIQTEAAPRDVYFSETFLPEVHADRMRELRAYLLAAPDVQDIDFKKRDTGGKKRPLRR